VNVPGVVNDVVTGPDDWDDAGPANIQPVIAAAATRAAVCSFRLPEERTPDTARTLAEHLTPSAAPAARSRPGPCP